MNDSLFNFDFYLSWNPFGTLYQNWLIGIALVKYMMLKMELSWYDMKDKIIIEDTPEMPWTEVTAFKKGIETWTRLFKTNDVVS